MNTNDVKPLGKDFMTTIYELKVQKRMTRGEGVDPKILIIA